MVSIRVNTILVACLAMTLAGCKKETPPEEGRKEEVSSPAVREGEVIPDDATRQRRHLASLIEMLKSEDPSARRDAARELGEMGSRAKEALPELIESLEYDDVQAVEAVSETLYGIGKPAVPVLIKALGDNNPIRKRSAAMILARFGPMAEEAVPALVGLLEDKDKEIVNAAKYALNEVVTPAAAPLLEEELKNPKPEVRSAAKEALEAVEARHAGVMRLPFLIEQLEAEDAEERLNAVNLLADLGRAAEPALPALVEILKNEDEEVRIRKAVIDAFMRVGAHSDAVLRALESVSLDKNKDIRISAEKAMERIEH